MTEQVANSMKDLFPGYYLPTEEEFIELWKSGIFVLDTNVLLKLYKYDQKTCDDFFKVLRVVSDRLWIPHQVALEFQENRVSTINERNQKLDNLRKYFDGIKSSLVVKLKQYPSIDYNELYKQIDARFKSFLDGLKDSEEEQLNISGNDFIREQIDQLFYNKIGSPPSKSELDSIYEEGKERYSNFYPPGFKDNTAEKKKSPYLCNGLIFKREYGDLIVWKEILKKVEEEQWKYIIFVTDDDKEDWWREEDGKTLSACPQLTEEIFKFGIKCFYMYSSDRFLKFAKQYIPEVDVKEESIGQVEEFIELAREQEAEENKTDILRMLSSRKVNLLVSEWLVDNYSFEEIIVQETGIDIICLTTLDSLDNQLKVGYEVKNSHKFRLSRLGMRNSLNQIVSYIQSSQLDKAYLVIVIPSSDSTTLAIKSFTISLKELMIDTPLTNFTIGLIVGTIINNRIDYPSPSLCFNELARIEP